MGWIKTLRECEQKIDCIAKHFGITFEEQPGFKIKEEEPPIGFAPRNKSASDEAKN